MDADYTPCEDCAEWFAEMVTEFGELPCKEFYDEVRELFEDDKLAVMIAWKRGFEIECMPRFGWPSSQVWRECKDPIWNWETTNYRVKPKWKR